MTGRRVFYALLLAVAMALHVFFHCFLTFFLLGIVILIPLFSLFFLWLGSRGFNASLAASRAAHRNAEEEILLSVFRSSHAPFGWAEFHLELTNRLTGVSEELCYCLCISGKQQESSFSLSSLHAGRIDLKIARVRLLDCFGLFGWNVCMDSDKAVSFLCFPLCRAIEWELPDYRQNDDEEAVAYSQHRPGDDPSEIFDIREYREGDNLKHIHWKLSWKLEQPMVKEFSLPLHSSLEIALELGKVPPEQLDLQLDLCFSLARVLLEGGLSFRLTWLGATMQSLHISDENDWEEAIGFLLSEPCREIPGLLFEDHIFLSQTYYITALISESLPLQEGFSVLYCGELTGQTRRLLRVLQDEGHVVFTPEDFFAQNSSRSSEE